MGIVRYIAKQMKKLTDQTDWERVNNMRDEDIVCDDDSPDPFKLIAQGKVKRVGRPKQDYTKLQITIRLDADIVSHLRSSGKGWQTRVNEYLSSGIKAGRL